jgi:hypothetical protein
VSPDDFNFFPFFVLTGLDEPIKNLVPVHTK